MTFDELIALYPEIRDVVEIWNVGAPKHGNDWLTPEGSTMSLKENCDSRFHHLARSFSGELLDESGYDHDLHIACRSLMSYIRKKRGLKHPKDKEVRVGYQVKSTKLDDSNCLTQEEAQIRYNESQYFFKDKND